MNLEEYIEKLKNDEVTLDEIPNDLLASNSEKYFELFKEGYINFEDIPENVMKDNIDEIFNLYEANVYIDFEDIPESVLIANSEKLIQFYEKNSYLDFEETIPEQVKKENPDFCKKMFLEHGELSASEYFDINVLTHEEIIDFCRVYDEIKISYSEELTKIIENDMNNINNINDYLDLFADDANKLEEIYEVVVELTGKEPEKALKTIEHYFLFNAYDGNINSVIGLIPDEVLNEEIIKESIEINPSSFEDIPDKYKENSEIKMLAFKSAYEIEGEIKLGIFTEEELNNVDFCEKIYDINNEVLVAFSEDILLDESFMENVLSKCSDLDEFISKYKKANIDFENIDNLKKLIKVADFNEVYKKYEAMFEDEYINKDYELLKYAEEIGKADMPIDAKLNYGMITEEEWLEEKLKEKEKELSKTAEELNKSEKQLEAAKALRDDIAKEKGLDEQKRGE